MERERDKKFLRKYEHTELTLDDDQGEEMGQIVSIINVVIPCEVCSRIQTSEVER